MRYYQANAFSGRRQVVGSRPRQASTPRRIRITSADTSLTFTFKDIICTQTELFRRDQYVAVDWPGWMTMEWELA